MSVSTPFIHRPIATSLLGVAVMLGGWLFNTTRFAAAPVTTRWPDGHGSSGAPTDSLHFPSGDKR